MNDYLGFLQDRKIKPNFWCSEEYFQRAKWNIKSIGQSLEVTDQEGNRMLPIILEGVIQDSACWCTPLDFPCDSPHWKFLDYNFVYDPISFLDLSGSRWKDTRKNLNWVQEDTEEELNVVKPGYITQKEEVLFWKKVAEENTQDVFDPEVMADYMIGGNNRLYIRGKDTGRVYGEVIWDDNYLFINFRYCIVLKNFRGLSDFCRVEFYKNIVNENKLVNDGGSLGREGLYKYKMRLNPLRVYKVYTWEEL